MLHNRSHYFSLALLIKHKTTTAHLPKMYIDKEWVAKEYLRRFKAGVWKKENTVEVLKCWNLERVLDAELQHEPAPLALTLDELVREETLPASPLPTNTADCDAEDGELV